MQKYRIKSLSTRKSLNIDFINHCCKQHLLKHRLIQIETEILSKKGDSLASRKKNYTKFYGFFVVVVVAGFVWFLFLVKYKLKQDRKLKQCGKLQHFINGKSGVMEE